MAVRAFSSAASKRVSLWLMTRAPKEQQAILDVVAATRVEEASRIATEALAGQHMPAEDREAILRYVEAVPYTVRRATQRPDDGGMSHTLATQLPRTEADMAAFLPSEPPRFRAGQEMPGEWMLDRFLGQGGFGEVWLARSKHDEEWLGALKFCLDPELKVSLANDLRHLAKLRRGARHPNIVEILTPFLNHDPPFFVLDYVDGGDLANWAAVHGGPVPTGSVVDAVR